MHDTAYMYRKVLWKQGTLLAWFQAHHHSPVIDVLCFVSVQGADRHALVVHGCCSLVLHRHDIEINAS
jgi:hypothetical protein